MTNADSDSLWVQYEPEPPRCAAIVIDHTNFDDVEQYFSGPKSYHDGLLSCTKHSDRRTGERTITLKFGPEEQSYEVTIKLYQVLYRSNETEGRYAVMDYNEFRRTWRKRLSQ